MDRLVSSTTRVLEQSNSFSKVVLEVAETCVKALGLRTKRTDSVLALGPLGKLGFRSFCVERAIKGRRARRANE